MLILLAMTGARAGAPLEIGVRDPAVVAVVLECGDKTSKATVTNGVASFPTAPDAACTVVFVRRTGTIDEPGQWTCDLEGCRQEDVHHAEISDAPGRINVVAAGLPPSASLEVKCPGGFRERQPLKENTAVFEAVPQEECTLFFKGGPPAKYQPLRWGTWYCRLTGATAVCTLR